jgi:class 3 adenylate cyclase
MINEFKKFSFSRNRGVVWVCDIASSSKFLNKNDSANQLEDFLPRLNWLGAIVVESAGGRFIKWTGDGFLAWFEVPLHREMPNIVSNVFEAVYHTTLLTNVTQLGVKGNKKIKLRHGITFEQDALITKIKHSEDYFSLDLTGRSVVLAFRLSSINARFPNVLTEREIVESYRQIDRNIIHFNKWSVSDSDSLKYFKGEKFGLQKLYASTNKKSRVKTFEGAIRKGKKALKKSEKPDVTQFSEKLVKELSMGPNWCLEALNEYLRFVKEDLQETLKEAIILLERYHKKQST